MKPFTLAFVLLLCVAAPVAAQDVTPAIDPGLAGIAAANRGALEQEAARASGRQRTQKTYARRSGARFSRQTVQERRALRRARHRAARGW